MKYNGRQWLSIMIACLLLIGQILPMGSPVSWADESKTTTLSGTISLPEGMVVPKGKTFTVAFDYGYDFGLYKKIVSIPENQSSVRYDSFEVRRGDITSVIKCQVLDDAGLDVVSSGYYSNKDGIEKVSINNSNGYVFEDNLGSVTANFNLEKGHRVSGRIKKPQGETLNHKLGVTVTFRKQNMPDIHSYITKKIEIEPEVNEKEYSFVVPNGSYAISYCLMESNFRSNLLERVDKTDVLTVTSTLENNDLVLQTGTRVHGLIMLPEEVARSKEESQLQLYCLTSGSAVELPYYRVENGFLFGIEADKKTMYYEMVVPKGACTFKLRSNSLNVEGFSTATGITKDQIDAEVLILTERTFEKNFVLRYDSKEKSEKMLEKPEDVVIQGQIQLPEDIVKQKKVNVWHTKNGIRNKVLMKRMNNSVSNFDYNIILNGDKYNSVDESPEYLEFVFTDDFNNTPITGFAKPGTLGVDNKADAKLNGMLHKGIFTANIDFRNRAPNGLALNKKMAVMSLGKSEKLLTRMSGVISSDKTLIWTSSNPSVASVSDQGVVTPHARGTATITAIQGEYSASCLVSVKAIDPTDGREVYEMSGKVSLPEGMIVPAGKTFKMAIRDHSYKKVVTIPEGHNAVSYSNFLMEGKSGGFPFSFLDYEIIDDAGLNIVGNGYYVNDGQREGMSYSFGGSFNFHENDSLNIANFNLEKGYRVAGMVKKPVDVSINEPINLYVGFTNLDSFSHVYKSVLLESNLDCEKYDIVLPLGSYQVAYTITSSTWESNLLTGRTINKNLSVTSDRSSIDIPIETGTRIYGLIMLPEGAQRPTENVDVTISPMARGSVATTSGSTVSLEPSSYGVSYSEGIQAGYKTMRYDMIVPKGSQYFKIESRALKSKGYCTANGLTVDPKEAVATLLNGKFVEKNFVLLPSKEATHAVMPMKSEDVIMQGILTLPNKIFDTDLATVRYTTDNGKKFNELFRMNKGFCEYSIILPGDKIASVDGPPVTLEFQITDETTGKIVSVFAKPGTNGVSNPADAKLNGMTERGYVTANVNPNLMKVGSIALNKTKSVMTIGKTETLQATLTPNDATVKTFTWTSSNPSIATVNNQGVVTSLKIGVATITAQHGNLSASCEVTVKGNDTSLASIAINGKPLQGFNSTIKKYQFNDYTAGTKLDISAISTAANEGATVKINDLNSPQSITLKQGMNKVDIKVTAEDGQVETYSLEFIVPLPQNGQAVTIDPKTEKTLYLPPSMTKEKTLELAIDPSVKDVKLQLGTPIQEATATSVSIPSALKFKVNTNANGTGNVSVEMPADVKVSSLTANKWDGQITLPTVAVTPTQTAVSVGVSGMELTFNKPVRIVIPNMSNKSAMWKQGDKTQEITKVLSSDSLQAAMNELTNGVREAKYSTGTDLVIWTTHFTEFIAYTSANAVVGGGGGGAPIISGGGGGGAPVNTTTQIPPTAPVDTTKAPAQTSTTPVVTKTQSTVNLTDISTHWAKASIMALAEKKIVSGNVDGKFMPDQAVTRAEFVSMLVKALDLKGTNGKVFSDTKGHWATEVISIAVSNGLVSGYEKDQFKPDHTITREEMAVILAKAKKLDLKAANQVVVKDQKDVSTWALSSVQGMMHHKLIKGYEDGSFKPKQNLTKAEAATLILKLL